MGRGNAVAKAPP